MNKTFELHLRLLAGHSQPYKNCRELSDCIHRMIVQDNFEILRKGFDSIFSVYQSEKDYATKNAIENVFLYRITTPILLCEKRREIFKLLPQSFVEIITSQMTAASI